MMNLKALNLKWVLAFAGAVAVAAAATLLVLTVMDGGNGKATAEGEPSPPAQVAQTATPTSDATSEATATAPSSTPIPTTQAGEGQGERCSAGWVLYDYPAAGYSVCIPEDWVLIDYSLERAEGTYVSIFDPDLAPWAGKGLGGTVPGGVKMGIRMKPAAEPYDRSTLEKPAECPTHVLEQISGRQVDVCIAKATDPQLPADRFAPGEEKSVGWVFPSVNGATLVVGAVFDSPVSAEDEATVAKIVESIRQ
jgi:hypothetical protein